MKPLIVFVSLLASHRRVTIPFDCAEINLKEDEDFVITHFCCSQCHEALNNDRPKLVVLGSLEGNGELGRLTICEPGKEADFVREQVREKYPAIRLIYAFAENPIPGVDGLIPSSCDRRHNPLQNILKAFMIFAADTKPLPCFVQ